MKLTFIVHILCLTLLMTLPGKSEKPIVLRSTENYALKIIEEGKIVNESSWELPRFNDGDLILIVKKSLDVIFGREFWECELFRETILLEKPKFYARCDLIDRLDPDLPDRYHNTLRKSSCTNRL